MIGEISRRVQLLMENKVKNERGQYEKSKK